MSQTLDKVSFPAELDQEIDRIMAKYPDNQGPLLMVLHACEKYYEFIHRGVVAAVAEKLKLPVGHVEGVVSFYGLYRTKDYGKFRLWVCRTLCCALRGSDTLIEELKQEFGADIDVRTKDNLCTIQNCECLAACDDAPVVLVNEVLIRNATVEKIKQAMAEDTGVRTTLVDAGQANRQEIR